MHKGKITSQKNLFESSFFTFTENTIDYGTFTRIHQDVYRSPAISVFPLTEDNELFLIKQYRYLYEATLLEAVAGIIEKGEDPITAARRELKEETGIESADMNVIKEVYVAGSFIHAKQYIILARNITMGESSPEDTEYIEVVKIPLPEAVEKVISGEIETASSSVGILLLDTMRKQGTL